MLALYDFGTPGFIALREQIWFDVFRRAIADRLPCLIFTFNPENSVPQSFIDELFVEIAADGGEVIPIELTASEAEIERRLGSKTRHAEGKLVDVAFYRELRSAGVFSSPVIPGTQLRLDTTSLTSVEAAARIYHLLH